MLRTINVVLKKAPGLEGSTLGARAAWAMLGNGGYDVNLICLGEGAYNLRPMPGYLSSMITRFASEDGKVFTTAESLEKCGLKAEDLIEGVDVIDADNVSDLIEEADATTVY